MKVQTFQRALWHGMQAFARALLQSVRQLFHQITGVFFFLFAVIGTAALVREWGTWPAGKLAVAVVVTAVFAWFTVDSFLRARRTVHHGGTETRRKS